MLLKKIKGILAVFSICIAFALVASRLPSGILGLYTSSKNILYILDAGHGIPDGGAVGIDDTTEQEINLSITLKLSKKLDEAQVPHILTRTGENSVYTEGETIHAKKVSDIKHRIAIASEYPSTPVISIHMNSYPDTSVHGIQVFYGEGNTESKKLAESLQNAFNSQIQPYNIKTVKPISKNVYLFSHIGNPAVLIECGFLSNADELSLLKTPEYQDQLVDVIANALTG